MISRSLDATGSGSYSEIDYFVYDVGAPNTAADHAIMEFIDPDGSGPEPAALAERFMVGPDLAGLVDQVYAQEDVATGATTWLLADNLGSTRDAVDANGTPTAHFNYSAFGQLVAGPTNVTPFLFTGEFTDPATGLQLNANRWYDPATGTWLSPDPADFGPGDPNLTRYALNQPTTFIDPTGFQAAAGAPDVYPTGGAPDAVTPADVNGDAPPTQVDGSHHLNWQAYSAALQAWWLTHGKPGANNTIPFDFLEWYGQGFQNKIPGGSAIANYLGANLTAMLGQQYFVNATSTQLIILVVGSSVAGGIMIPLAGAAAASVGITGYGGAAIAGAAGGITSYTVEIGTAKIQSGGASNGPTVGGFVTSGVTGAIGGMIFHGVGKAIRPRLPPPRTPAPPPSPRPPRGPIVVKVPYTPPEPPPWGPDPTWPTAPRPGGLPPGRPGMPPHPPRPGMPRGPYGQGGNLPPYFKPGNPPPCQN